jgi:hypothetical protein
MPQYFLIPLRLNGTGPFRFPERYETDTAGLRS